MVVVVADMVLVEKEERGDGVVGAGAERKRRKTRGVQSSMQSIPKLVNRGCN
jgi:hypothetical protein